MGVGAAQSHGVGTAVSFILMGAVTLQAIDLGHDATSEECCAANRSMSGVLQIVSQQKKQLCCSAFQIKLNMMNHTLTGW